MRACVACRGGSILPCFSILSIYQFQIVSGDSPRSPHPPLPHPRHYCQESKPPGGPACPRSPLHHSLQCPHTKGTCGTILPASMFVEGQSRSQGDVQVQLRPCLKCRCVCLYTLAVDLQSCRWGWIQRAGGSPSRSGRRIRTRRALVGLPWRCDKESENVIYCSHYLPMPRRVRRHESLMKITTRVRRYLGRAFGFCILTLMLTLGPGPISCRESSPCIT